LKSEQDLENHTGIINWVNVKDREFMKMYTGLHLGCTVWSSETLTFPVARAHVQALLTPDAAGHRFITSAGPFAAQDWCDVGPQYNGFFSSSVPDFPGLA
jgi:hypothetical protein